MKIWTRDQMNMFLDSVKEDRLFALWRLACRTGMRRGELAGLRWADVDLDAGELSVRQNLVIVGTTATIQEPKTPAPMTAQSKRSGKRDASLGFKRSPIHQVRRRYIFDSQSEGLEDQNLLGRGASPNMIRHYLAKFRCNVLRCETALLDTEEHVAGLA